MRITDSTRIPGHWYGKVVSGWESVRESYWFVPSVLAVAAAALALLLIELDSSTAIKWSKQIYWIRDTNPDGARAVLSAIASSTITVTGVVFSITIVALTLASSQFGPRLLRTFLRDRGNQFVLGTFVSTFLYSLIVLRSIGIDQIPYLATTGAVLLAITSTFVLIYFLHHAASSIQASSVIATVAAEIDEQLPHLFPSRIGERPPVAASDADQARLERLRGDGTDAVAQNDGFVRVIDHEALIDLTREHGLLVELQCRPGHFVARGRALARVGPAACATVEVLDALRRTVLIGDQRTAVQDLPFLTGQFVEMAVRALSPGVNDPHTAIACVQRLGAVVAAVAERDMPSPLRYDEEGILRVVAPVTTFEQVFTGCFEPIGRYAMRDASVVAAILEALGEASILCPHAGRRQALLDYAAEIRANFTASGPTRRDAAWIEAAFACLKDADPHKNGPPQ